MSWTTGNRYGLNRTEILDREGQAVATVWTHKKAPDSHSSIEKDYHPFKSGMENLRLIAAAPDLLEIVQALIGFKSGGNLRELQEEAREILEDFGISA